MTNIIIYFFFWVWVCLLCLFLQFQQRSQWNPERGRDNTILFFSSLWIISKFIEWQYESYGLCLLLSYILLCHRNSFLQLFLKIDFKQISIIFFVYENKIRLNSMRDRCFKILFHYSTIYGQVCTQALIYVDKQTYMNNF